MIPLACNTRVSATTRLSIACIINLRSYVHELKAELLCQSRKTAHTNVRGKETSDTGRRRGAIQRTYRHTTFAYLPLATAVRPALSSLAVIITTQTVKLDVMVVVEVQLECSIRLRYVLLFLVRNLYKRGIKAEMKHGHLSRGKY